MPAKTPVEIIAKLNADVGTILGDPVTTARFAELGGATMIGALWGVFVWKEFRGAPRGTNKLLGAMFFFYLVGLAILVASRR